MDNIEFEFIPPQHGNLGRTATDYIVLNQNRKFYIGKKAMDLLGISSDASAYYGVAIDKNDSSSIYMIKDHQESHELRYTSGICAFKCEGLRTLCEVGDKFEYEREVAKGIFKFNKI